MAVRENQNVNVRQRGASGETSECECRVQLWSLPQPSPLSLFLLALCLALPASVASLCRAPSECLLLLPVSISGHLAHCGRVIVHCSRFVWLLKLCVHVCITVCIAVCITACITVSICLASPLCAIIIVRVGLTDEPGERCVDWTQERVLTRHCSAIRLPRRHRTRQ